MSVHYKLEINCPSKAPRFAGPSNFQAKMFCKDLPPAAHC